MQLGDQRGGQSIVLGQVDALQALLGLAFPVQSAAARCEQLHQHAVLVAQAGLVVAQVHPGEIALHQLRFALPQVAGQAVFELRGVQAEAFQVQAVVRIEAAVGARFEHGEEVAFGVQQAAFVLLHDKALQHFHLFIPFILPWCRCCRPVERRGWSAEEVGLADVLSMRSIPSIPGLPCPVPEPRAGRAGGGFGSLALSGLPGRLRSSPRPHRRVLPLSDCR